MQASFRMWTEDEKAYLKANSGLMSDKEIQSNLVRITGMHRSVHAIIAIRRKMGIYKKRGKCGVVDTNRTNFLFIIPEELESKVPKKVKLTKKEKRALRARSGGKKVKKVKLSLPTPLDLFRAEKKREKEEERRQKKHEELKERDFDSFGVGGVIPLEGVADGPGVPQDEPSDQGELRGIEGEIAW